jgi:hypothetical protein
MVGVNVSEQASLAGGSDFDDGCPRALKIGAGVEVADQQVALNQLSDRVWNNHNAVGIDVAVARHSGSDGGDRVRRSGGLS